MSARRCWTCCVFALLLPLAGCGGGGGGSPGSPSQGASYLYAQGFSALLKSGAVTNFAVSGTCSGTALSVQNPLTDGLWSPSTAGAVTVSWQNTLSNCAQVATSTTSTTYFDVYNNPVAAIVPGNYFGVFNSLPPPPASVAVGYMSAAAVETLYSDPAQTSKIGSIRSSFVVEADSTSSSAIIHSTSARYDNSGTLLSTEQDRYRIQRDGTLSWISMQVRYADAQSTTLTYTSTQSTQNAGSGAWTAPAAAKVDFSLNDTQMARNSAGIDFLLVPFVSTTQAMIEESSKADGQAWTAMEPVSTVLTGSNSPWQNFVHPQVVADAQGNAIAAWDYVDELSSRGNVYVVHYDKTTGWSAPILIQSNPAEIGSSINLAGQSDGTAWVVWTEQTVDPVPPAPGKVALFAARYSPGSGWGAPERVTADITVDFGAQAYVVVDAKIATDGAGNPSVLWSDNNALYATSRTAGTWAASTVVAPTIITQSGNGLANFAIAVDSGGNAVATWQSNVAPNGVSTVYTSQLTAGAGWSSPLNMSLLTNQNASDPALAMDAGGNAILLWSEYDGTQAAAIWSSRFVKGAGWQLPSMISSPPDGGLSDSTKPTIGFDAAGDALALWKYYDLGLNQSMIRACRFDHLYGWGANVTVSATKPVGGNTVVSQPTLAVAPDGRATVVWGEDDTGNGASPPVWSDFTP
jgi:hypothetical protein